MQHLKMQHMPHAIHFQSWLWKHSASMAESACPDIGCMITNPEASAYAQDTHRIPGSTDCDGPAFGSGVQAACTAKRTAATSEKCCWAVACASRYLACRRCLPARISEMMPSMPMRSKLPSFSASPACPHNKCQRTEELAGPC